MPSRVFLPFKSSPFPGAISAFKFSLRQLFRALKLILCGFPVLSMPFNLVSVELFSATKLVPGTFCPFRGPFLSFNFGSESCFCH